MIRGFFVVLFLIHGAAAAPAAVPIPGAAAVIPPPIPGAAAVIPPPSTAPKWKTLKGNAPVVIARGGFSGVFPESSDYASKFALQISLPNVVVQCNLQLTKDMAGICNSNLKLENWTSISTIFPDGQKTYIVNGESVHGYFALDYTYDELMNVTVTQSILSRPSAFDFMMPIPLLDDVIDTKPPALWLNVEYYSFLKEHKLDPVEYISGASKTVSFAFISSPEINFLKDIGRSFRRSKTKLIFRFLQMDSIEPSTNSTYGSLLKDLTTIKSFAAGILVPKDYIWPVGPDLYLDPSTTLVADAHKLGLEVYASGFANDALVSYNYSYDPVAEYLQFVDNADFSVDGVLTDFPSTASEAIACFAHNKNAPPKKRGPLIITHNGASGVFAGSTDLAYQKAVEDGADVIDCSVQMSKDGVPFCLDSADLMGDTTALTTFMSRSSVVPEIQKEKGIFSFDLTWSEIQSLKPQLTSPMFEDGLLRNPAAKNQGKFMTLPEFLDFAKNSTLQGILIHIKNAAYLASQKSLGTVDAVSSALSNASYDKVANQQVFIQSDDTSVLSAFKNNTSYKRVFYIYETISDIPKPSVDEIKTFADAVNIARSSVYQTRDFFLSSTSNIVGEMQSANISVFVSEFRNEFSTLAFDFFADPTMELASYVNDIGVDGLVTEFPATANAYLRNPCADPDAKLPYTILAADPGGLLHVVPEGGLGPAQAPAPALDAAKIIDPPLPDANAAKSPPAPAPAGGAPKASGQPPASSVNAVICILMAVVSLMCLSYS